MKNLFLSLVLGMILMVGVVSADSWTNLGKDLSHSAWDGQSYTLIPNLNQVSYQAGDNVVGVAVGNGYVYFGGLDNNLYQANASNVSQIINVFDAGGDMYVQPAVVGDYVYIQNYDTNTYYQLNAFNVSQVISFYTTAGVSSGSISISEDGYAYFSGGTEVYQADALNISNIINTYSGSAIVFNTPAIANGYLYIGTILSNTLYQLNATNISQFVASFSAGDWFISSPIVTDKYVYIGSEDDSIYQLNASNISQAITLYATGNDVGSSAAVSVSNDYVYITSVNGDLNQLNATDVSQLVHLYATGSGYSQVIISDKYAYVGGSGGQLFQLNVSDVSQVLNIFQVSGAVFDSRGALTDDYLYWGSGGTDDKIYQLNAENISRDNSYIPPVNPTISIVYPINTTYTTNVTHLDYTMTDSDYCWYSLNNGATNTSMTCGDNITGLLASDGTHTWIVYANNSNGEDSDLITFFVNTTNVTIPEIPEEPTPEDNLSGNAIYEIMNSAGAGLGLFMVFMGQSLPILLIIFGFIGIVIAIGFAIAKVITSQHKFTWGNENGL